MLSTPLLLWPGRGIAETSPAVDVRSLGAKGNGRTSDTHAIQAAIDAAAASGRIVWFPPGDYVSGTLRLRHGTTIRLDAAATLVASPRDSNFDPLEARSDEVHADDETADFNFALLQGRGIKRVRILGPGRIDGNRRSRSGPKPIALKACEQIEIRDLTITNAGNYNISLLDCEDVDIRDIHILNGYSDGIDPDCCRNVRITRCRIDSRDDALCLKSSLIRGVRGGTANVQVDNCHLVTVHNGIKLGTESSGGFRHIAISDCTVVGRRHALWGDLTSGVALTSVDGGVIEHVAIRNIRMTDVRSPIFVRLAGRGRGQRVRRPGALRDVSIRDVVATGAQLASSITGIPGYPVERIALQNIQIVSRGSGRVEADPLHVPEMERRYPDAIMFPDLPAYGLYVRHVVGVVVEAVDLATEGPDARPAMILDDVRDARIQTVQIMPPANGPVLWLHAVRDAQIDDLRASGTTVRVSGAATARIRVARRHDAQAVQVDGDVGATAVRTEDRSVSHTHTGPGPRQPVTMAPARPISSP